MKRILKRGSDGSAGQETALLSRYSPEELAQTLLYGLVNPSSSGPRLFKMIIRTASRIGDPQSRTEHVGLMPRRSPSHHEPRLQELARSALKSSGYRALALLECQARGDAVVLSGHVPSFYLKQVAQTVILRVAAVAKIENRVEVGEPLARQSF